jgi:flagellar biosynthetic protein FliR
VSDLSIVVRIALLLVRPGMVIGTTSAFGSGFAPVPVRIGLILLLALVLMPVVALPATLTPATITMMALRETLIGLALAMSIRLVLGAAEIAGQFAGFQLGFTYATLVDPQSGARNSMMSSLYSMLTLFIFIGIDGHHEMLRALAASYDAMPVGPWHVDTSTIGALVARMLGLIFVVGVQLAAPVILVLLLVELVLGLMARTMPTLNLMISAAPVRLLVGMIAVLSTLQIVPTVIHATVRPALELAARLASIFR